MLFIGRADYLMIEELVVYEIIYFYVLPVVQFKKNLKRLGQHFGLSLIKTPTYIYYFVNERVDE